MVKPFNLPCRFRSTIFVTVLLLVPTLVVGQAPPANTPASSTATPTVETAPAVPAPNAPAAQAPVVPPPTAELKLPRNLTPWGMFLSADIVVKVVMVGLVFASVITWTIWFAKVTELIAARRRLRTTIKVLSEARSLADCVRVSKKREEAADQLVRAVEAELHLSSDALDPVGVKERIASRLERIEAAAGRQILRGTGILATIGATAPFVGLFGTVWGIMNSFIGISRQHTTNLAVVAPGIAEALLATALGLVAAIPAVVMYNLFSRWIASYRALQADAAAEVMRLVSRDLDRDALRPGERRLSVFGE
jgi:biopolymer transport protein ExbB